MSRYFAALACAALAPAAMAGDITFTFDDPVGGNEFMSDGLDPANLTYDTMANVELEVDTTSDPMGAVTLFDASLSLDLVVGMPASLGGLTAAPITGTFAFTDTLSGDLIFSAELMNAQIVELGAAGSVISAVDNQGIGLAFTAGPALNDLGVFDMIALDAVFTLTDVQTMQSGAIFGPGPVVNPFNANSAFTATANAELVPTPGAAALAGIGLMGIGARRRRR